MKEIFADTFYFLALLNPADASYQQATEATAAQSSKLVTTAWILTELADALSKHDVRAGFIETLRALQSDPTVVIVAPEQRWFDAGIELYAARADKDWSLTDCISFVVMKDRNIADALTGDHHFEQAGFRTLLK